MDHIAKPKSEAEMHAVVVDVTIEDWRGSTKALNERTQPRLSQSRGVIAKVADVAASA